jgi:hypothetical protein
MKLLAFLNKFFYKRCHYCKKKKKMFWYLWDTKLYVPKMKYTEKELEICTDCAKQQPTKSTISKLV